MEKVDELTCRQIYCRVLTYVVCFSEFAFCPGCGVEGEVDTADNHQECRERSP